MGMIPDDVRVGEVFPTHVEATLPTVRVVDTAVDGGSRIVNKADLQPDDVLYIEPKK